MTYAWVDMIKKNMARIDVTLQLATIAPWENSTWAAKPPCCELGKIESESWLCESSYQWTAHEMKENDESQVKIYIFILFANLCFKKYI